MVGFSGDMRILKKLRSRAARSPPAPPKSEGKRNQGLAMAAGRVRSSLFSLCPPTQCHQILGHDVCPLSLIREKAQGKEATIGLRRW